ncbi:MAG: YkgJ family cysteine cluster protein, partial [Candidatus Marinimicrobia bacterium]|nr:YkgJ family cysteine cluster protein [Candidatus Neomarinimicrobiota bacterium]
MTSLNINQCRKGCGACCVVISITSPLPGMPEGKPAGMRCVNLDKNNYCIIHDGPTFPSVCRNF